MARARLNSRNAPWRLLIRLADSLHPILSEFIEQLSPGTHWSDDQILREEIFSIERLEQHAQPGRRPAGRPDSGVRPLARHAPAQQRKSAARGLPLDRQGGGRRPRHHTRRRMGARQLSRRRRADPRDPRGSAAAVLSPAAQTHGRAVRRLSARVRHRLGFRRAHRQPLRARDAAAFRARLSDASSRSRSASSGRSPSRCASCSWRTCAASRNASSTAALARQEADAVADRLLGVNGQKADPNALRALADQIAARCARRSPSSSSIACAIRIRRSHRRCCGSSSELDEQETSSEQLLQEEHQRQGASNVTVRNIITSMRLMSDVDWAEFFESVSLVDEALAASPDFAAMDFATRNLYRNAIEEMGRGSTLIGARDREACSRLPRRQPPTRANAIRAST